MPLVLFGVVLTVLFAFVLRLMFQQVDYVRFVSDIVPAYTGPFLPARLHTVVEGTTHSLAVDVWYPRDRLAGTEATQKLEEPQGVAARRLAQLGLIEGAAPAAEPLVFPFLLFTPGWNGDRRSNTLLLGALASAGFVVAAIDDLGGDGHASGIDGAEFEFSPDKAFERSWQVAGLRLAKMTDRCRLVVDTLISRPAGEDWPLAGRLRSDAIGALGFSFGGTVAAEMPDADSRVKASANLDGWLMGTAASAGIAVPYLSFSSEFPNIEKAAASWSAGRRLMATATIKDRHLQRVLARSPDTYALIVAGTQHGDFTDGVFSPSLRSYLKAPWGLSAAEQLRVHSLTVSLTIAFFDTYLRNGKTMPVRSELAAQYPELIWIAPP